MENECSRRRPGLHTSCKQILTEVARQLVDGQSCSGLCLEETLQLASNPIPAYLCSRQRDKEQDAYQEDAQYGMHASPGDMTQYGATHCCMGMKGIQCVFPRA